MFLQKCISYHKTKQSSKFQSDLSSNCFTIDVWKIIVVKIIINSYCYLYLILHKFCSVLTCDILGICLLLVQYLFKTIIRYIISVRMKKNLYSKLLSSQDSNNARQFLIVIPSIQNSTVCEITWIHKNKLSFFNNNLRNKFKKTCDFIIGFGIM